MKGLLTTLFTFICSVFYAYGQDPLMILSLEQCVEIAIDNNLSMKRSELNYQSNQVNLSQAQANRYPSLNFGANYGTNWGRSIDPTTNLFITRQINTSGISGSAGVVLFGGGQIHNSIRQSKEDLKSSSLDMEQAKNNISLDIATFYLNVIFNNELVENAKKQLESAEQQLVRTKRLVAAGSLPRTSELELLSQVASNEVNLVNAQNNLALAKLSLKQAMLIPAQQQIEIIVPDLNPENIKTLNVTSEEIYQTALSNQPDIKSADIKVESAEIGVKVASGALLPRLSLNGNIFSNYSDAADRPRTIYDNTTSIVNEVPVGYFYTSANTTQDVFTTYTTGTPIREVPDFKLFDQWNENFSQSFSFNLQIPVFNKFSTRSSMQRSQIQKQQAEISSIETRNNLRQKIESAYIDALASSKSYTASLRQVEALEETFRAVENQYNLGAANFTDYQIATNNLFGARSDLVRAKYNYIFKSKILDFYQGKPLTFEVQ